MPHDGLKSPPIVVCRRYEYPVAHRGLVHLAVSRPGRLGSAGLGRDRRGGSTLGQALKRAKSSCARCPTAVWASVCCAISIPRPAGGWPGFSCRSSDSPTSAGSGPETGHAGRRVCGRRARRRRPSRMWRGRGGACRVAVWAGPASACRSLRPLRVGVIKDRGVCLRCRSGCSRRLWPGRAALIGSAAPVAA